MRGTNRRIPLIEDQKYRVFLCLVHDDVIKWKHFQLYWHFVRGIHRSPVDSPYKCQWRGAWINGWANNREAGDWRRHCAHYDVTIMIILFVSHFLRWQFMLAICNKIKWTWTAKFETTKSWNKANGTRCIISNSRTCCGMMHEII